VAVDASNVSPAEIAALVASLDPEVRDAIGDVDRTLIALTLQQSPWDRLRSASRMAQALVRIRDADREHEERGWQVPDRGAERASLLAKAAPGLASCAAQAERAFTLSITFEVDASGAISDMKSSAEQAGTNAARCAEQVLMSSADFAPAPIPTRIPIKVTLTPP
jgi:hypothetical protein